MRTAVLFDQFHYLPFLSTLQQVSDHFLLVYQIQTSPFPLLQKQLDFFLLQILLDRDVYFPIAQSILFSHPLQGGDEDIFEVIFGGAEPEALNPADQLLRHPCNFILVQSAVLELATAKEDLWQFGDEDFQRA